MTAPVKSMGRNKRAKLATAVTVVAGASALLLATEVPSGISLLGGGSTALAELIARSPGVRMGGVALKAKAPRAIISPDPATASISGVPAEEAIAPRNAIASVFGTSAGPEGPVVGVIPGSDSPFPSDFVAPAVPTAGLPESTFPNPVNPGVAPFPFLGGIGSGGGGGGGPLIITPGGPGGTIPGTPTDQPPVDVPPQPPQVGGVPEPQAWALLIIGFGAVGFSMRQKRRAAFV